MVSTASCARRAGAPSTARRSWGGLGCVPRLRLGPCVAVCCACPMKQPKAAQRHEVKFPKPPRPTPRPPHGGACTTRNAVPNAQGCATRPRGRHAGRAGPSYPEIDAKLPTGIATSQRRDWAHAWGYHECERLGDRTPRSGRGGLALRHCKDKRRASSTDRALRAGIRVQSLLAAQPGNGPFQKGACGQQPLLSHLQFLWHVARCRHPRTLTRAIAAKYASKNARTRTIRPQARPFARGASPDEVHHAIHSAKYRARMGQGTFFASGRPQPLMPQFAGARGHSPSSEHCSDT